MKTLAIRAKIRNNVGKSDSKALRNQGNVPCVLYGGEKQVCFYSHENEFRKLVYSPDVFIVELEIDGEKYKAIMQDIQFHPVTDKVQHIDFLQVFDDKEITVSIPVRLKGLAIGVRNGGSLLFRRKKIITRALPSAMPSEIEINIESLKIGQFIYISDVRNDNYTFLAQDTAVVVGVKTARNAIEDEAEEEEVADESTEATESKTEDKQKENTEKNQENPKADS